MISALKLFARFWALLPETLRRFIGYGVASGTAMAIVLTMYLFWGTGYLQEKLGVIVTRDDLKVQEQTRRADEAANLELWAGLLQEYDTRLKEYLASERSLAVDTTLVPMLRMIYAMDRRLKDVSKEVGLTKERVDALPAEMDAKLRRLVEDQPPDRFDQMERDRREFERAVFERLDQIEQLRGKKITKGKF